MDLLNQLVVNRLIQENKYLKQELEMAKSNILILEEKESQYKSTIEHINNMNNGKEISHKNIISLINNYKKRENEFKQIIKDSKNNFAKKENELNTKILILQKKFNKNEVKYYHLKVCMLMVIETEKEENIIQIAIYHMNVNI